jgi:hypothetical protein
MGKETEKERTGKYLLVYLLDGKRLNIDIFNWNYSDLNGNKPWIVADEIVEGYADISTIANWDSIGRELKDYSFVRNEIKNVYDFLGNEGIGEDEAKILCQLFILPKDKRDIFYTEDEQKVLWSNFVNASMLCREHRWESAKNYISYFLEPADSSDLAFDTQLLCENYIKYNITEESISGKPGLIDYIKSTSVYADTGFSSKDYWSEELQTALLNILENGI